MFFILKKKASGVSSEILNLYVSQISELDALARTLKITFRRSITHTDRESFLLSEARSQEISWG